MSCRILTMKSKSGVSKSKAKSVGHKSIQKRTVNTRGSALKMIAAMEKTPDTAVDLVQDFLTTGRTGRRNAMPDILGEHAATSTADLPACMQQLNTAEASTSSGASTSSSGNPFCLQYAPSRPGTSGTAPTTSPAPSTTPPDTHKPAPDCGKS